jgi:hypothetical protein
MYTYFLSERKKVNRKKNWSRKILASTSISDLKHAYDNADRRPSDGPQDYDSGTGFS